MVIFWDEIKNNKSKTIDFIWEDEEDEKEGYDGRYMEGWKGAEDEKREREKDKGMKMKEDERR